MSTGSWFNPRSLLGLVRRRGFFGDGSGGRNPASSFPTPVNVGEIYSMRYGGWKLISSDAVMRWRKGCSNGTNIVKKDKVEPLSPPKPSGQPNFPSWAKWVLASILSILIPYWKHKWEQLLLIEQEVEVVVQGAEKVAEVVEQVATTVEEVSEEVAKDHPGDGKLKDTALLVEAISKTAAQDAQATVEFLQKIDALKHDFDDLESMVEPVIDKFIPKKADGS